MNFNSKINFTNLLKPYNVAAQNASSLKKQKSFTSAPSFFQKSFGGKPACLLGKNIMPLSSSNSCSLLSSMFPGKLGSMPNTVPMKSVLSLAACTILPALSKKCLGRDLESSLGDKNLNNNANPSANLDSLDVNEAAPLDQSNSSLADKLTEVLSSFSNSGSK